MEIAIMGAGMAGLSCAITLERNGITPVIFEKRSCVGDRFINAEAMFSVLNRPIKDSIKSISQDYGIDLKPIDRVNKLIIHSKNEVASIEENIGYTNVRGRHDNSYERQLEKQVKTKIQFHSEYEYDYLKKNFEKVILAPGDAAYSTKLNNFRTDLTVTIKGSTVEGDFLTDVPHVWFDYDILPKGYGWLLPFSEKEANLVIAYPDYPENQALDLNTMWKKFYDLANKSLDQSFKITDEFEITRYIMGICEKPKIDNTYFVGNCFGAISPGLGFGQFASILTGVYAAQDICGIGKYEELVKPLFENYNHSIILRRYLESLTNNDLDFLIKSLDNKIVDKFIDKVCSKEASVDIIKYTSGIMRSWNSFKG